MSRSGYVDDLEGWGLYRGTLLSAIRGKRGQRFLKELVKALDAMPVKELIKNELIDENGQCCTLGAYCQFKSIDCSNWDVDNPNFIGNSLNIARQLVAEIEFMNDEYLWEIETPQQRWKRMRAWVTENINES